MTTPEQHDEVRRQLRERYGPPVKYDDVDGALRRLNIRHQINPVDAAVFLHESREAAEAYVHANLEHFGHPGWALDTPDGFMSIVDLRSGIIALGGKVTDP